MEVVLILLCLLSLGGAVVYRPDFTPHMKNTSLRWTMKAKLAGPNVCAKETIWGATPVTYDTAWTGGSGCTPSTVKLDCCEGWSRVDGERGCTRLIDVATAITTASSLHGGKSLRLLNSAGLDSFLSSNADSLTIFNPLDHAWSSLSSNSRRVLEDGSSQASRLVDAPPLLLSHVIHGRRSLKNARNDELLTPLTGQPLIRINKYPNGLITANCLPIVNRDVITQGPLLQTLPGILPQGYLFSITDTVLRDVQARRFANLIVQSHLESQLRIEDPHTLFLPTDAAVERLSHHQLHALLYNSEGLRALVLNHVVAGVQCGAMLSSSLLLNKNGNLLKTECRRSANFIQGAAIVSTDKMATNGVIHVIDRVLVPRRAMILLDLLKDLGLTSFVALVERAGLLSTFLSPDSFTLFTPTNEALEGTSTLPERDARNLVLNHMTADRAFVSTFKSLELLPSRGTRPAFTIKVTRDKVLVDAAVITSPDIEGLNGVVHVIDRALLPPRQVTILQYLQDTGRYSYFLNAIQTVAPSLYNVIGAQENRGGKTVFAVPDSDLSYHLYYRNEVVRNHIVGRTLMSEEIPSNGSLVVPTLGGSVLVLARRENSSYAGSALIVSKDIICSDGVIHVVRGTIVDTRRYWGQNYSY